MVGDILLRAYRTPKGPPPLRAPSSDVRALLFSSVMHYEGPLGPRFSIYETLKVILLGWWLPFVRLGGLLVIMIFYRLYAAIVFFNVAWASGKPMPPRNDWRMCLMRREMRIGCRTALRWCGIKTKIFGKYSPQLDDGWEPPVISNHTSYVDIVILAMQGHHAFVAKAGLAKAPIIRTFAALWQVVLVKRKAADSRTATQDQLRNRCFDHNAPSPTLFPEGSTTNGKWLMPFRPGIFRLGMPVQPVLLHYPHKRCNVAWDTCTISLSLWRCQTQVVNHAHLHYLPVYYPTDAEKADARLFAEGVRRAMVSYAETHDIELQTTETNVLEKLIYQDYCDGKISWGKALEDLQALYDARPDDFSEERKALLAETVRRSVADGDYGVLGQSDTMVDLVVKEGDVSSSDEGTPREDEADDIV
ncbi:Lysophospholipid acyltransferase-like [Carpediemonas membranifera]|uniref:Lysophospholipid acyltransferase-like n=1 Tax=Carpediemonas membranifera TaxID=201153 RepID=A0A8J6BVE6_9EUKA|nr:Lysophospholipid acyltransferase-like [Carpediemonas membranifera]|eukprot:KAG9391326.1 Lysophospholipid acyltransferase-like [Carpediemonas membranifera]